MLPHVSSSVRQKIEYNSFLMLEIENEKPLIIFSVFNLEIVKVAYC